jgi:hypothetical protein
MPIRNQRTRTFDYDNEESLCIINKMEDQMKKNLSAEGLVAIPTSKGSKKYVTYLGLLDTGCSNSLINKEIVEFSLFDINLSKVKMKWTTQAGMFETDGMMG